MRPVSASWPPSWPPIRKERTGYHHTLLPQRCCPLLPTPRHCEGGTHRFGAPSLWMVWDDDDTMATMGSRSGEPVTLLVTQGRFVGSSTQKCANLGQISTRRDGRVVDGGGLENHCTRKGTGGSNPSLSASASARVTIQRGLRRDGFVDTIRSRRSLGEGGRIPPSPPTVAH